MTVISGKVNKLISYSKWWEGKQNGALADDLVNSFCGGTANNMLAEIENDMPQSKCMTKIRFK